MVPKKKIKVYFLKNSEILTYVITDFKITSLFSKLHQNYMQFFSTRTTSIKFLIFKIL